MGATLFVAGSKVRSCDVYGELIKHLFELRCARETPIVKEGIDRLMYVLGAERLDHLVISDVEFFDNDVFMVISELI